MPVRVWDLPTRLFHWLLVLAVVGCAASGEIGGDALVWHFRLGYVVLGLLVFRLVWGVIGGHWSRFAQFFYLPGRILAYWRASPGEQATQEVGHSPVGSLSVWALLLLLCLQVSTGLVADDEIATTGPFNKFVSSSTALLATSWHKAVNKWLLLALVLLHVAAIAYYRQVKGKNLVGPMWHGDKLLPPHTPASRDTRTTRMLAFAVAALDVGLIWWLLKVAG